MHKIRKTNQILRGLPHDIRPTLTYFSNNLFYVSTGLINWGLDLEQNKSIKLPSNVKFYNDYYSFITRTKREVQKFNEYHNYLKDFGSEPYKLDPIFNQELY